MNSTSQAPGDAPTLARLDQLAVIGFDGADAASFLHGQFSTDVTAMPAGTARWTSYNSPKGRVLATLLLWRRAPDSFAALVAADLAPGLRKRMTMFVLRAKVAISDRSAAAALFGIAGSGAAAAIRSAFGASIEAGQGMALGEADVVATPDGRYAVCAPLAAADAIRARLPAAATPTSYWDWLGVRAGVPVVTAATQDLFIPQTLNLDLIGGIDFRKGCYPGQEIVARMQYLGRLKERLFAFHVDAPPPSAGTRIHASTAESPVGTVINAASVSSGSSDLLAVVAWDAAEAGDLRLGAVDGPRLAPLDLPYVVPAPVAPSRVKL